MDILHFSGMFVISVVSVFSVAFLLYRRRLPVTDWPFIGMTPDLLLNVHRFHDFITDLLKLGNPTFMLKGPWYANMDMLITADPANIHHMLSKNFPNYLKGREYREIFEFYGDGIFNSDDELWEMHRKVTMSLFKHPDFHTLVETTMRSKIQNGLLPFLDFVKGRDTDLQEVFQRFTFDTICSMLLDYDPESLSVDLPIIPCEQAFTGAEEALLWRHIYPKFVWKLQQRFGLGKEKVLSEATRAFDEFIYECLSRKENMNANDGRVDTDRGFFTSLTRAFEGQTGTSGDSKKFLKDTILNLMVAGRDTTSTTLSWFFYLLAKNPTVEKMIRDEIQNQLGGSTNWESLGSKDLDQLVYLHGGLCEALRLYPPVPLEYKEPSKKDVLPSGHAVDPHTRIILSFYSMGRMEQIWGGDCHEFKPERWFSTGGKGIKHEPSYKFPAFHAGPRSCLGKEMSFVQMKMVATAIIYRYRFELVEGHEVCPSDSLLLQMKYGLKVRVFSTK